MGGPQPVVCLLPMCYVCEVSDNVPAPLWASHCGFNKGHCVLEGERGCASQATFPPVSSLQQFGSTFGVSVANMVLYRKRAYTHVWLGGQGRQCFKESLGRCTPRGHATTCFLERVLLRFWKMLCRRFSDRFDQLISVHCSYSFCSALIARMHSHKTI